MSFNYMDIIGIYYPTSEATCNGDQTNYNNITWISSSISQSTLEAAYATGGYVEAQSAPPYTEFEYAESSGSSSSSSTSWTNKVSLSFNLVSDVTVLFRQSGMVRVGTSSRQILTQLLLDNTIVINNTNCLLSNTDRQIIDSISTRYDLTAGPHTLNLQFCRGSSSTTAYIEKAAIAVIKAT